MELVTLITERLAERRPPENTQKWLAEASGLREAAVSELVNNRRSTINREHLVKIAAALGITDVRDLLTLK